MKQFSRPVSALAVLSAISLFALGAATAQAGTQMTTTDTKDLAPAPAPSPLLYSQEFNLDYSYTGRTSLKQGDSKTGNAEAQNADAHYVFAPQINDNVILRFGFDGELDSFGLSPNIPVSNTLQAYNLDLGADFTLSDKIIVRAELHPGFFGDNRLSSDDFNMPIQIGGTYLYNKDFQLIAGIQINLMSQYPVFGFPGFRWQLSPKWVISAIPPKPQIQYLYNKDLTLYFGAALAGDTFKMSKNFGDVRGHGIGSGNRNLDSAWVDYDEVRIGAGVTYKITKGLFLDASGGVVPIRDYIYDRAKLSLHNDSVTPYVSIGINGSF